MGVVGWFGLVGYENDKEMGKFACLRLVLYILQAMAKKKMYGEADGWVVLLEGVVVQVCAHGETVWAGI
jgi:hypothetical protein